MGGQSDGKWEMIGRDKVLRFLVIEKFSSSRFAENCRSVMVCQIIRVVK